MKIQKLQAKIDAGICTDCDIQTYLKGLAIAPTLSAEAHYLVLMAQDDVLDVAEVTEERNVLITPTQYAPVEGTDEYSVVAEAVYEMQHLVVSEAFSANTARDNEIASLVLDYPHLVEPEQTYTEAERFDEHGLIYFEPVADVMPTTAERRPELVLDATIQGQLTVAACKVKMQAHLDSVANRYNLDKVHNGGIFRGNATPRGELSTALGQYADEYWDAGAAMFSAGVLLSIDEVLAQLPEFTLLVA